jgi:carbamoyl-phosphate synthase small subunit
VSARTPAILVLKDGTVFRGTSIGADGLTVGEVVFNTAMTGYQEVLTDPSYTRQIVTMTVPQVGNYGINDEDSESGRVQIAGLVVRELARRYSNHRARRSLDEELTAGGAVGIAEVDTRRLTRHLREAGAMRAAVSTAVLDADALLAAVRGAPRMEGSDLATTAGTDRVYTHGPADPVHRIVALDFGMKRNQLRLFAAQGVHVTVVPATATADEVLAHEPDGLFVSNGPGDPAAVTGGIATLRTLLAAELPTFGICLGHQLLALAGGATTSKLRFGHRGTNQPVRNLERATIEISSHNHGFAVDADLPPGLRATHVNLNDGVNEGLRFTDLPAFSVQYHPEAAPGTHDARYLFAQFGELMGTRRAAA